jgi:hypothetical protein
MLLPSARLAHGDEPLVGEHRFDDDVVRSPRGTLSLCLLGLLDQQAERLEVGDDRPCAHRSGRGRGTSRVRSSLM